MKNLRAARIDQLADSNEPATIPEAGHCLVCGNEPAACEFELCQMLLHFSIKLLNVCMQPTENYGNACSLTLSPFINDCDYSGAYSAGQLAVQWNFNGAR